MTKPQIVQISLDWIKQNLFREELFREERALASQSQNLRADWTEVGSLRMLRIFKLRTAHSNFKEDTKSTDRNARTELRKSSEMR